MEPLPGHTNTNLSSEFTKLVLTEASDSTFPTEECKQKSQDTSTESEKATGLSDFSGSAANSSTDS